MKLDFDFTLKRVYHGWLSVLYSKTLKKLTKAQALLSKRERHKLFRIEFTFNNRHN